jgi:hypothetical protein
VEEMQADEDREKLWARISAFWSTMCGQRWYLSFRLGTWKEKRSQQRRGGSASEFVRWGWVSLQMRGEKDSRGKGSF